MRNRKLIITCGSIMGRHHAHLNLYSALPEIGPDWLTLRDLVLHTCVCIELVVPALMNDGLHSCRALCRPAP